MNEQFLLFEKQRLGDRLQGGLQQTCLFLERLILRLLFLLDEVVPIQMLNSGLGLLLPALHLQDLGKKILHLRHIRLTQFV